MNQVIPEVKVEEKKIPAENISNQTTQAPITQEAPKEESEKDINWKKFKEARALERKQAEEMAKRAQEKEAEAAALKAALEAIVNKPNQQQHHHSNNGFDEDETEDQRIEKKVNHLLAQREADAIRKREQEEQTTYPEKLKSIHTDFDQVCSAGNLDYLEYHHPELAKSLGRQPQGFEKWNDIYKAIKRYVPNTETKKDSSKAEANFNKPQSLSSPAINPSGQTSSARLTEERRAENWARMQKQLKGLS